MFHPIPNLLEEFRKAAIPRVTSFPGVRRHIEEALRRCTPCWTGEPSAWAGWSRDRCSQFPNAGQETYVNKKTDIGDPDLWYIARRIPAKGRRWCHTSARAWVPGRAQIPVSYWAPARRSLWSLGWTTHWSTGKSSPGLPEPRQWRWWQPVKRPEDAKNENLPHVREVMKHRSQLSTPKYISIVKEGWKQFRFCTTSFVCLNILRVRYTMHLCETDLWWQSSSPPLEKIPKANQNNELNINTTAQCPWLCCLVTQRNNMHRYDVGFRTLQLTTNFDGPFPLFLKGLHVVVWLRLWKLDAIIKVKPKILRRWPEIGAFSPFLKSHNLLYIYHRKMTPYTTWKRLDNICLFMLVLCKSIGIQSNLHWIKNAWKIQLLGDRFCLNFLPWRHGEWLSG